MGCCICKPQAAAPWLDLPPEIPRTRTMGGCICKPETAAPWAELPPEIAGRIFCRVLSHDDRRSFGAVCSQWRLAARQQRPLPPVMPCINLGHGTYQSLIGGKVRRFPAPKGYRAGGSFGGWLFYYHEGSHRCFLSGPSADAAIKVPTYYRKSSVDFPTAMSWASRELPRSVLICKDMDMKMIVCSSDLVVALFRHPHHGFFHPDSYLAFFRAGQLECPVWSFVVQPHDPPAAYVYTDIAFYQGKVFALSSWGKLFCHELLTADDDEDMNNNSLPAVIYRDTDAQVFMLTNCYLVVSSDKQKLLMVRWRRRDNDEQAMDLWVFEADFDEARWLEVKDLGDQVLFLGRNCSMAFATSSSEHWGQRFRGGNRVFVLGTDWAWSSSQLVPCKDIPSYCVYDMTSGETSLVSLEGACYMERCTPGWFLP